MVGLVKKTWIVANWKSNKTNKEALDWISKVGPNIPRKDNLKIVVCPTFSCISDVKKAINAGNFPLMVGSQDISPFEVGAFTGEESAELLKELVDVSIIGHSERRKNFSETDDMVAKKVQRAKESNITALVCIQDKTTPVPDGCNLVAYEPVWAIGSGTPDTPENAQKVAQNVKDKLGREVEVLYGGSVKAGNVEQFISQENISGVLIGGASLDADEFIKICQISSEGI